MLLWSSNYFWQVKRPLDMNWFSEVLWTQCSRQELCALSTSENQGQSCKVLNDLHPQKVLHTFQELAFRNETRNLYTQISTVKILKCNPWAVTLSALNCIERGTMRSWESHFSLFFPLFLLLCLALLNSTKTWIIVFCSQIQCWTLLGSSITWKHLLLWNGCSEIWELWSKTV